MLRIYLDTNLLTKIKDYPSFEDKLNSYTDYLNIVYSSAHIDDLKRSTNYEKTQEDLKTIKKLSENQCLAKYWGQESICYDTRDPFEFYESFQNSPYDLTRPWDFLQNEFDKLGIENPLKNLRFSLPTQEVPLDIQNPFNRFTKDNTFESLFEDVTDILRHSLNSNEYSKKVRESFDKKLPRNVLANVKENVIDYLNDELPKTDFNKSHDDYVIQSLKLGNKDKCYSDFDWFVARYYCLDLVGYKSDNKSTTANIITDAFHSFYAAHCDVFITEDKRLRQKSKVLYEEFDIETLIFSQDDFCEHIDKLISKFEKIQDLTNIYKDIRDLPVAKYYSIVDTKTLVAEYFLQKFFIGYYDYIICVYPNDNSSISNFIKKNKTFSKWYYFKELKSLITPLVDLFGPDIHGNRFFLTTTHETGETGLWIGRKWFFDNFVVTLTQEIDVGILLRFETYINT